MAIVSSNAMKFSLRFLATSGLALDAAQQRLAADRWQHKLAND
jgi:hypothetical protein